jgi:hypothetical protein
MPPGRSRGNFGLGGCQDGAPVESEIIPLIFRVQFLLQFFHFLEQFQKLFAESG